MWKWTADADAVLWESEEHEVGNRIDSLNMYDRVFCTWSSSKQCPITSEHPSTQEPHTQAHGVTYTLHVYCPAKLDWWSIKRKIATASFWNSQRFIQARHSVLSRKHRQLQVGNVMNNNWLWIRVTLHLKRCSDCVCACTYYVFDWELPLRQNDLRSRLRPRCNRFHLTLTSSSREMRWTGKVPRTEISAGSPVDKAYCHFWNISSAMFDLNELLVKLKLWKVSFHIWHVRVQLRSVIKFCQKASRWTSEAAASVQWNLKVNLHRPAQKTRLRLRWKDPNET